MDEGSDDEVLRGSSPEGAARIAPEAEVEALQVRLRQQQAVADLGRTVLEGIGLATLLERAAELVAGTLRVECCQILWTIPGEEQLLLCAAAGYDPALVGRATVGTGRESQAGHTMMSGKPVIVEDVRAETRFAVPGFVRRGGTAGPGLRQPGRRADRQRAPPRGGPGAARAHGDAAGRERAADRRGRSHRDDAADRPGDLPRGRRGHGGRVSRRSRRKSPPADRGIPRAG